MDDQMREPTTPAPFTKQLTDVELTEKYRGLVNATDMFMFRNITAVNYSPHPFVLGADHEEFAKEFPDCTPEEIAAKRRCYYPECNLPYAAHTYDKIIALSLTRDANRAECSATLEGIAAAGFAKDGIEGYVFIDSDAGNFKVI